MHIDLNRIKLHITNKILQQIILIKIFKTCFCMRDDIQRRHKIIRTILCTLKHYHNSPKGEFDYGQDTVKYKSYETDQFAIIRSIYEIDESYYPKNFKNIYFLRNRLFRRKLVLFYTWNFSYVVKIIHKREKNYLLEILENYACYLNTVKKSFLSKIFGCYKISSTKYGSFYVIVMNSVFPSPSMLHEVYDLKGSYYNRFGQNDSTHTLKDIDWLYRKRKLDLSSKMTWLCDIIARDVSFLEENKILDYSLVVGIKYEDDTNEICKMYSLYKEKNGTIYELKNTDKIDFVSRPGSGFTVEDYASDNRTVNARYYIGIIDFLTNWSILKKVEHLFSKCFCRENVSCTDPESYKIRFLEMLTNKVFENTDKIPNNNDTA